MRASYRLPMPTSRGRRRKSGGGRRRPSGSAERATAGPSGTAQSRRVEDVGAVGRRPAPPVFLALVGVAWIGAGVISLVALHAGWKLVPTIAFCGVGLLFLRGAAARAAGVAGGTARR